MPLTVLIPLAVTFLLNKALPAVFHAATHQATPTQVQQAKELLDKGDSEAEKIQSLQGMTPVVRLQPAPATEPTPAPLPEPLPKP
jgi:hypothetical protein